MSRPTGARVHPTALLAAVTLLWSCTADSSGIRRLPLEPTASAGTITISPGATSLGFIGQVATLTADVKTADGGSTKGLSFSWTSTNSAVAAVSTQGVVRAVGEGTTQILVRVFNVVDSATVTVRRVPATLALSTQNVLFTELGKTVSVTAAVADGGGEALAASEVVWRSTDTTVVQVTSTGTISSVGQGRASVLATAGAIQSSVVVLVATGPSSIVVQPGTVALTALGDTIRLQGHVADAAGAELSAFTVRFLWGDTLVASVDSTGLISARGVGNTTVTIIGDTVRATVPVTVSQAPATVLVTPDSVTLTPGGTTAFIASVADRNGNPIKKPSLTWSSTNATVATVTSSGTVTAVAAGTSSIIARAGAAADTSKVNVVVVPIDSISVTPDSVTLEIATNTTLTARYFDASGTELIGPKASWSSKDNTIAIVSQAGKVTALKAGSVWVHATKDTGKDSTAVTVNPAPGQFNLEVRYVGTTPSAAVQAAFATAEARWEQIILGDLPNVTATATAGACGIAHPAVSETVDDLLIFAEVAPIDGAGGILGQAGPCLVRVVGGLAIVGTMQFDDADLVNLLASGDLESTILHEMGHVLGFGGGTPWSGTLVGAGGADPYWPGAQAVGQYDANGGTATNKVPVANTGGAGTRDAHWREAHMGRELMTGFLNSGVPNPLSSITVGAMEDMGYVVDITRAESYTVSATLLASPDRLIELRERPMPAPWVVDAAGRILGRARR